MAKTVQTRPPARPAPSARPAVRPAPPTRPAAAPPSRAQQAAQHQNRPAPAPARPVPVSTPAASPQQRAQVPARNDASVPDYIRRDSMRGQENIRPEDMETPRLKLMQGLSPELQQLDDLRAGNLLHSIAEYNLGESFLGVIAHYDFRYILWRPRDSGGGILARADDGVHWSPSQGEFTVQLDRVHGGHTVVWRLAPTVEESGLQLWGSMNPNDSNSPPAATKMYNFVLAFPEYPELPPAVLTFQRAAIKRGQRLLGKLRVAGGDVLARQYRFTAITDHNRQGQEFYTISAASEGWAPRDTYELCENLYDTYSRRGLSIRDIEGLQGETVDEDASNAPSEDTPTHEQY